ncbi:MAG TPA: hypothetical protein VKR58_15105 [Aquella sp.]|nr:hypothetical protein [Aquella sp.]
MIKYREHRGSLEESLKTSKEFNNIKELFEYILFSLCHVEFTNLSRINLRYYGFDKRCNQELFVVSADDYGVFGFVYE